MNIGVLTSSRADYGIYRPLLKRLAADDFFNLHLFAFGTHVSHFHGHTLDQLAADGFAVAEAVPSLVLGDSPEAIATAMATTTAKFASIWARWQPALDVVLALGDRYEMFAAVAAGVPFGLTVGHLHGGETTLGAIDNQFRHAISLMSRLHFVATPAYAAKVAALVGQPEGIYHVGALSLDNMLDTPLLSVGEMKARFGIDLRQPTILVTFHPETIQPARNAAHAEAMAAALELLAATFQIVITLPNADTMGALVRQHFLTLAARQPKVVTVENFGTQGYFSCMHHARLLVGNTSSGIIEAASFGKFVVNVGDRQRGRACSENVRHVPVDRDAIATAARQLATQGTFAGENIYFRKGAADAIVAALKEFRGI